jgi:transposase InsO family protein
VRFSFVAAEKASYPVRLLCRCLEVSRAGFYAWQRRGPSSRAREDAVLSVEIAASHTQSRKNYGSPRILRDLRDGGRKVSRKRVARLMRQQGLEGRRRGRRYVKTTDSKHPFPVAANILMRDFKVPAPNVAWATDITYVWTAEGWLYLAAILDLFSRRVVGFAMSDEITRKLPLAALRQALSQRPGTRDLIHHSDRGSQYASQDYRRALEAAGITCSMSRRGDCWDNAVVESFFGTLKSELMQDREFATKAAAILAITEYIEDFYNARRRHSSLGYVSPLMFELQHAQARLAA